MGPSVAADRVPVFCRGGFNARVERRARRWRRARGVTSTRRPAMASDSTRSFSMGRLRPRERSVSSPMSGPPSSSSPSSMSDRLHRQTAGSATAEPATAPIVGAFWGEALRPSPTTPAASPAPALAGTSFLPTGAAATSGAPGSRGACATCAGGGADSCRGAGRACCSVPSMLRARRSAKSTFADNASMRRVSCWASSWSSRLRARAVAGSRSGAHSTRPDGDRVLPRAVPPPDSASPAC